MEEQSVAKNLIYQRKLKGYSQEELSEKASVTVRTIQRIEKGEVNPHLQTIKLLATGLDVEVEDLIVLENPKEESIQKKWLLLIHGTPILGLAIPLCNVLFPLFLWIHKREDNAIYERHGRAVINFQITMTILFVLAFIALFTIEGYGFFFFIAVIPFTMLVSVINLISAINSGKCFYPLAIPFLRKGRSAAGSLLLLPALVFSGSLAGGCQTPAVNGITRLDGSTITADSLDRKLKQLMHSAGVHGLAVTVFNDNRIAYERTFGYRDFPNRLPLNDTTNIYGASLSKAVFAVLVMKLVEEGVIDLDTPLESYLPKKIYEYEPQTRWHDDYTALRSDSLYHRITARMCLDHTSGFPNWRGMEPGSQLRVKQEPGSRYLYSGEGMVYLQVVLEKLLGRGLVSLADEKIFVPLGMTRSSFEWQAAFEKEFAYGHQPDGASMPKDKDNEARGPSTLETTAVDMGKFLQAVLQQQLLSESSWREMFTPQIRIRSMRQFGPLSEKDTTLNDKIQLSYGFGWGLLQTPHGVGAFKEGHGSGFVHYFILFPEAGKGVMIMSNSENGEGIFKELLEVAVMDTFTPWEWEQYIPYDQKAERTEN